MVLAGLLTGAEVILPNLTGLIPPRLFAAVSFIVVASAFIARLTAQKGVEE